MYTCTGWHRNGEKIEWRQWYTYDRNEGCPEHGTAFFKKG